MNRTGLCNALVCSLGLAAVAALGGEGCGGEAGGPDGLPGKGEAAVPESAPARALVSKVQAELVWQPSRLELPPDLAEEPTEPAAGAVLGESAAERFVRDGAWLLPVVRLALAAGVEHAQELPGIEGVAGGRGPGGHAVFRVQAEGTVRAHRKRAPAHPEGGTPSPSSCGRAHLVRRAGGAILNVWL
ncbi:MAG: hypothetical protein HY744_24455 [Deltaproteobacteria bacterium]|nr:hypothetical protein [Deltaproteobacteria bacterium]